MNLRERLRSLQGVAPARTASPPPPLAPDAAPNPVPDIAPGVHPDVKPDAVPDVEPNAVSGLAPLSPRGEGLGVRSPEGLRVRTPERFGPESLLPGRERETPYGPCYVAEWRYDSDHLHGHTPLGDTLAASLAAAAVLLVRTAEERHALAEADPRRIVYLDTETTGLAGGTGTYAFLVGVARFRGDEFVVRQLFMRTLGEEHALLHVLAEELDACDALVTYNGKAFDWPLLETRYTLGRRFGPRRPPIPAAHADLLFSSRRLWRGRLESCALSQVEHHLLGVRRGEDTPGWLIPQLYFAYLRTRDARPLAGVFRHNALDILSLAGLLGHIARIGRGTVAGAPAADEVLALGRCLEEAGDADQALACYEAALRGDGLVTGALRAVVTREARRRAGALLKRQRRGADALAHWEAMAAAGVSGVGALDVLPYEELARYYEHTARDLASASAWVRAALALLDTRGGPRRDRDRARLLHRLARLERTTERRAVNPRPD